MPVACAAVPKIVVSIPCPFLQLREAKDSEELSERLTKLDLVSIPHLRTSSINLHLHVWCRSIPVALVLNFTYSLLILSTDDYLFLSLSSSLSRERACVLCLSVCLCLSLFSSIAFSPTFLLSCSVCVFLSSLSLALFVYVSLSPHSHPLLSPSRVQVADIITEEEANEICTEAHISFARAKNVFTSQMCPKSAATAVATPHPASPPTAQASAPVACASSSAAVSTQSPAAASVCTTAATSPHALCLEGKHLPIGWQVVEETCNDSAAVKNANASAQQVRILSVQEP